MANYATEQPRLFIMDSSRANSNSFGKFMQNNNRYTCTLLLFDNSVPVTIPDGADIAIKCRLDKPNSPIYVMDKNHPDFNTVVSFTPDTNEITVDKWADMVMTAGAIILGVTINGISTYSVTYSVDEDKFNGKQAYITPKPLDGFAKADLSNVSNEAMLRAGKAAGLAQNDLADVDLNKLDEKFQATDSGKQLQQVTQAVSPAALGRWLKQDPAFARLSKTTHPDVQGKTDAEIRALFQAHRYEEQRAVDFTQPPYKDVTTLLMVYQLTSNDQTIVQQLPPVANNQVVMVEVLRSTGVTGGKVQFTAAPGDTLDGYSFPKEVAEEGYNGYFLPMTNESSYDFFGHEKTQPYMVTFSDDEGNVSVGANHINFKGGFLEDDGAGKVDYTPPQVEFNDKLANKDFVAKRVQSIDGSIRISNMGNGVADLSVSTPNKAEGIMATVGWDELINSEFPNNRIYFGDIKQAGGQAIHADMQTKSFVVQDIDPTDDPLVSGGTTIFVGLYYEPSAFESNSLTQDGSVRVELVNDANEVLTDVNGDPMGVQIDYKAGDVQRPELYLGEYRATTFTRVHLRITPEFPNEEILSVGANTAICLQAITKEQSSGDALMAFMAYTGHSIRFDTRYYGMNSLNLAQFLVKPQAKQEVGPALMSLGNDTYLDLRTKANVEIKDYHLNISDNSTDIPVFSLYKRYNPFDTHNIKGGTMDTSVVITDKDDAYKVSLMKYTGTITPAPQPNVLRYDNENPVFEPGWVIVDSMFITEDVVSGEHTERKTFTIPSDVDIKELAVVFYAVSSQTPLNLNLKDFEVDLKPAKNRIIVTDRTPIQEKYLEYFDTWYKSVVVCPKTDVSYRYTANSTKTKIPVGVVTGKGTYLTNDHSWTDPGSSDPYKVQGAFKFDVNATAYFEGYYLVKNEQSTVNNVEFFMEKVQGGQEVSGSRIATTIEANRKTPKKVPFKFSMPVKKGETYQPFMQSDKDDGFYLECTPNGQPMVYFTVELKGVQETGA